LEIAINLLKKNNGNILACEQEFHNDNIKEICITAECNKETARESYNSCNYNKTKAIEKINLKQVIITTRESSKRRNEIGYIIWPENKDGENYKTKKRNDAFIPSDDFEFKINEFKSVYPIKNPWKSIEKSFDVCGHNYFNKVTCKFIINKISERNNDEVKIKKFKDEIINWLNDKLDYADYIVVYGNL
jgi:hypothetical protein